MTSMHDDTLPHYRDALPFFRCIAALAEYAFCYGLTEKAKAALERSACLQADKTSINATSTTGRATL